MMPVLIGLLYVNEFRSLSDLYDSHIFHFSSSSFKHLVAFFFFLSLALCVQFARKKCVHGQIQSTHTNIAVKQSTKARNVLSFFAIVFIFRTNTLANRCNTELQIDSLFVLISFFVFGNVYIWYASWRHCQFQWNHTFFPDYIFFLAVFFIAFLVRIICILFWYLALFFSSFMHTFSMKFYFIDSTEFDYHLHWNTMTKIKNQRKRNKPQARL